MPAGRQTDRIIRMKTSMKVKLPPHSLIESSEELQRFHRENQHTPWLCFDTEFIGEKRFFTTLCLIQVATPKGNYVIDPLKVEKLEPLLDLLTDDKVLKIVHAASNDYRLLYNLHGIIPKHTFDTQIASAFIGYKYPVAFNKLLDSELHINIGKGFSVADWERRPVSKKQLRYALYDVVYLYDLYQKLKTKLESKGRFEWAMEECKMLENPEYYETDPYKETLQSNLIKGLRFNERVMLLRLLLWRTEEARRRNHSKEMVLPGKYIGTIVRSAREGLDAFRQNRRLPEPLVNKYGQLFIEMYNRPATEEEKEILSRIPRDSNENPRQEIIMEMLDLLVRYKCQEAGISHHLVLPRQIFKRLRFEEGAWDPSLETGWRREFLGEEIITWLRHRHHLQIAFKEGKFELTLNSGHVNGAENSMGS